MILGVRISVTDKKIVIEIFSLLMKQKKRFKFIK